MRLVYLTDRLSDRGGADQHLAQVISSMSDAGHEVSAAFGRDEGGADIPDRIERHRFRGLSTMVDSGARLGGLGDLLDGADVIHVQNVMNPTALTMATGRGRTVVTIQDHRFFCPGRGKTMPDGSVCLSGMADGACRVCIVDHSYRRATIELTRRRLDALGTARLVVLSRYMVDELEELGASGALVLPPWVETGEPRSEVGSVFTMGGRLVSHKGPVVGWRAWRVAGCPLPLLVAGEGPLGDKLEGAQLLGWLDPVGLRAALRRARALIFPSGWQEPFGILGLEALAQGTPVIVADAGGTGEWSSEGCIGVPAGDVDAMAGAIGRLAGEPALALELGRAGQKAVRERFGRGRIEPRLRELYREVALS